MSKGKDWLTLFFIFNKINGKATRNTSVFWLVFGAIYFFKVKLKMIYTLKNVLKAIILHLF